LAFLAALSVLTAVVWWRVIDRGEQSAAAPPTCAATPTVTALPQPSAITVTVLNTTQRDGLAAGVAAELRHDGFTIVRVDTDSTQLTGIGQIQYSPGEQAAATLLSYYLPGTGATVKLETPADADVVILLGATYKNLANATAVHTAMSAAHLTFSPATSPTPSASRPSASSTATAAAPPSPSTSASHSGDTLPSTTANGHC
jgi:hypothetical protein